MTNDEDINRPAGNAKEIPDGTAFVIVDLDYQNEQVQVDSHTRAECCARHVRVFSD